MSQEGHGRRFFSDASREEFFAAIRAGTFEGTQLTQKDWGSFASRLVAENRLLVTERIDDRPHTPLDVAIRFSNDRAAVAFSVAGLKRRCVGTLLETQHSMDPSVAVTKDCFRDAARMGMRQFANLMRNNFLESHLDDEDLNAFCSHLLDWESLRDDSLARKICAGRTQIIQEHPWILDRAALWDAAFRSFSDSSQDAIPKIRNALVTSLIRKISTAETLEQCVTTLHSLWGGMDGRSCIFLTGPIQEAWRRVRDELALDSVPPNLLSHLQPLLGDSWMPFPIAQGETSFASGSSSPPPPPTPSSSDDSPSTDDKNKAPDGPWAQWAQDAILAARAGLKADSPDTSRSSTP